MRDMNAYFKYFCFFFFNTLIIHSLFIEEAAQDKNTSKLRKVEGGVTSTNEVNTTKYQLNKGCVHKVLSLFLILFLDYFA